MDIATLRVAFALVAMCVLVLFYAATYQTTRSAFSGWWCLSLIGFLGGSLLYLFTETSWRWLTIKLNTLFIFNCNTSS